MAKILVIITATLALVIAIFLLFKKDPAITNFPSRGTSLIAFGDSLVEGVGATKDNDFVSILSKLIGQPIINMGVSGNTSKNGLDRIDTVTSQKPKVVLVLLGGNDFLRKIPKAETFKNIDDVVFKIQQSGAVVILLGVRGGILTDQYEEQFENIADNRGALYVKDVLDGIITNQKYMSDAIHPNDAGYKKIAEKVEPALKKALGL